MQSATRMVYYALPVYGLAWIKHARRVSMESDPTWLVRESYPKRISYKILRQEISRTLIFLLRAAPNNLDAAETAIQKFRKHHMEAHREIDFWRCGQGHPNIPNKANRIICIRTMKFDENGRHIKGMHRNYVNGNDDVVDLKSRHPGISDSHLNAALDTIPASRHKEFHAILDQLKQSLDGS